MIDKSLLLKRIIDCLTREAENLAKGAREAHKDATGSESKAENKYDTRGLEASYLAGAQAKLAAEALEALGMYQRLELKRFSEDSPIALTALIELESEEGIISWYFLGPKSGGIEVTYDEKKITLITPSSPMGGNLLGKSVGDSFSLSVGGKTKYYEIISVY